MSDFSKVLFTGPLLYALTITFTKLSILALYRRIFIFPKFKHFGFVLGVVVVVWCAAVCVASILICIPLDKAWDPTVTGACINLPKFFYGIQIPNVVTDVLILVLPLPAIARLQLPFGKKMGLMGLFAVGIL